MTKVQKISEMLLDAIATTRSISEGFDKIMGEGAYEKLALPEPPAEIIVQMDQTEPEAAPQIGDTGSSQVLADEIGMDDPTDEEIDESNAPQFSDLYDALRAA